MIQSLFVHVLIFAFSLGIINPIKAQVSEDSELFQTLKDKDSLLFNVGFNTCDFSQFEKLTTFDLEFYHDTSGVLQSQKAFMTAMANGICKKDNSYHSRRELLEGSLEVFPLYENGILYGAIQNGAHKFYERHEGKETEKSTAKFSNLWILKNNQWQIKRIYSYNHKL